MAKTKYSIGLDIGNSSVGWAVINPDNYKVVRKGNKKNGYKHLWGVRLFEEANTAEGRRLFRGARKRYDRRRKRIELLQAEFKGEINKIDPTFYQKMQESFYQEDDKINKKIIISTEEKEQIKKYHEKYPSIYHLRNSLIKEPVKFDIRLVYLAIHHIIKYRGNFLYGTSGFKISDINIKEKLEELFINMPNLCTIVTIEDINNLDFNAIASALNENSKTDRKRLLEKELSKAFSKKIAKEFVKVFIGEKFSINTLFDIETDEELKVSFKGSDYDDNISKIEKNLNNEIEILEDLKEIYDNIFLKQLIKDDDFSSLSDTMVKRYANHKEDLKELKRIYRENKELYKKMFKSKKSKNIICIYEKYVSNNLTFEDFRKQIEKDFSNINLSESLIDYASKIIKKLENETFMPRITNVENGKYPYQFNKEELIKIIENQGRYYPFLLDKLEDGTYKLVRLLEFKIPYYVGPLNNTTKNKNIANPNSWMVRKNNNIAITPYNYTEVIDLESSAEQFIERMIRNCTYLLKEKAMPSNSILYSKFKVLNELKQIKVGEKGKEEKLSIETQKRIYNELFLMTDGTITDKKFKEYLRNSKEFSMFEDISVLGYSADNKFANNMNSYYDFFGSDGYFKNTNYETKDAENIIRYMTIFEDKDILKNKLEQEYPELENENVKKICQKNYRGWSNLSEQLLTGLKYTDKKTGFSKSIMDLMEETTSNFMQIINDSTYNFDKKIRKYNKLENDCKISYKVVNDLATSPATKRGIFQALKIVEEIIEYMGYEPNSIVLEMARGSEKKERKDDKKKRLETIYEKSKSEIENYNKLKRELSSKEKIDSKKLFLYFIQEGKSLYSGTSLEIDKLHEYEIDHIIPRTLIKDDSIDNLALVLKEENQIKAASFVLPEQYRSIQMKSWWQHLKKLGLISDKKYNNLCRYKFDEKSIEGFINRQLVETRQICKHVANIINNYYENINVYYIPAALSHNYREKFKLYKFREINDYHHAHDAYLAAVLGEYKNKYLKQTVDYEFLKELNHKLYENKKYKEISDGYVINSLDPALEGYFISYNRETGEVEFDAKEFNKIVEETLYSSDILISKKVEFKTGEFYNETKQKKGNKGASLKKNLPTEKYGSYTSIKPAYAIVVNYIKKGKEEQKMIGIPIYIAELSKNNQEIIINYIKDLLKVDKGTNIKIIRNKIPFNSLLNWDNQICYLVGATETVEVVNAKEFKIEKAKMIEWKETLKCLFSNNDNAKNIVKDEIYSKQLTEIIDYIILKIEKEYVLYQNLLEQMQSMFKMENLTIENKETIVKEMFNLLKCDSVTANLKRLDSNYSMAFGKKNNRKINHAIIINKSITGLREITDEF